MIRRSVLVMALAAGACLGPQPDRSSFYVLTATVAPSAPGNSMGVTLGLGPVTLPAYLVRSELVTRVSENQLAISPVERWAEPLDGGVVRTLEANLRRLLRPEEIVEYPWYASEGVAYGVEVAFTRLEADSTGAVTVAADWRITNGDRDETFHRSTSSLVEPSGAATAEASVAAMSRALAQLSEQVAAGVRLVHGDAGRE